MTTTTDTYREKYQSAGNNLTLKAAKKLFNKPIYRECLATMNLLGEQAALTYLQQYVLARYGR